MKTFNKLIILFVLVMVMTMALVLPMSIFAEENETIEEVQVDENQYDNAIVNGYEDAKDQAQDIVEKIGLKEYLSAYFEENMVDLIITIVVTIMAAFIFLASIFFTIRKLIICIRKYGVESDATKLVISDLTKQLKETSKASEDAKEAYKLVADNNELLRQELERIKEAFKIVIKQDESLMRAGLVDEAINIIEEK